jgi:hypothetical protein
MANTFTRFLKGIILKPETANPTEQVEGSLYQNSATQKIGTFIQGADRQVVTDTQVQTLTNKTISGLSNTITNIDATAIADGSVTNAEFQFINTVTSNVQTQLDSKASQVALDAHINDVSDAHDASAISYDNTTSGLTATEVQAAIDELAASSPSGAILADGSVPMAADLDLDGNKIVNLADPVDPQDAATKTYVDGIVGGTLTIQENGTPVVTAATILNFISGATIVDGGAGEAEITISGGGTTISGTADVIAKFNATGDNVEDSNMSDDGTNIIMDVPPVIRDAQIYMTDDSTDKLFIHTTSINPASDNVFVGYNSGTNITSGGQNTALGTNALRDVTGGTNTAVGYNSMLTVTSEQFNTAVGQDTLMSLAGGTHNTAMGYGALTSNENGTQNAAFGLGAAGTNTTGESNTAVGTSSLGLNTLGNHNTAVGFGALGNYNGTSGISGYNVALGSNAGSNASGDSYYNLFIGPNAGPTVGGAVTQKMYIDCGTFSASDIPLIYGDGSLRFVRLHNSMQLPSVSNPAHSVDTGYGELFYSTDGVVTLQDDNDEYATLGGRNHTQTIANNQVGAATITDMVYSSATYRSIKISYSINRTTTVINLTQTGTIILRVDSTGWAISDISDQGSIIGVTFTVDTGTGQVSYTSTNASGTGHVGTMKWCVKDQFTL